FFRCCCAPCFRCCPPRFCSDRQRCSPRLMCRSALAQPALHFLSLISAQHRSSIDWPVQRGPELSFAALTNFALNRNVDSSARELRGKRHYSRGSLVTPSFPFSSARLFKAVPVTDHARMKKPRTEETEASPVPLGGGTSDGREDRHRHSVKA